MFDLWLSYKIGFLKNKQTKLAELGSEYDNMMNERRRQPSTGQKREMNTLADSNYFYTEKSLPCTNFCGRRLNARYLHGRNHARNL